VDLVVNNGRCEGAYILDEESGHVDLFQASSVVLATGGASKAYLYTRIPMAPAEMELLWPGEPAVG
jgi:L-aspartate oxidase